MEKIARKLQRKATTTVENGKLKELRTDVYILNGMITHTENVTALKVFHIEIIRQSSTGKFESKETLFGWHIDNEDRKTNAKSMVVIVLPNTGTSM